MGCGVMTLSRKHVHKLVLISMSAPGLKSNNLSYSPVEDEPVKAVMDYLSQSLYSRLYLSLTTYPQQQRYTGLNCLCPH